ncbi:hypothetical protein [Rhodococcus wratislaviensis]|uniref:hypothetical protein n=1 Tax=Rhodococcus wratislaviensis TaxID=44752 RepID=UPI00365ADB16
MPTNGDTCVCKFGDAIVCTLSGGQHLVLAAAAVGLIGLGVFHLAGHRTAGARLASAGFGVLLPAAVVAALEGINSL